MLRKNGLYQSAWGYKGPVNKTLILDSTCDQWENNSNIMCSTISSHLFAGNRLLVTIALLSLLLSLLSEIFWKILKLFQQCGIFIIFHSVIIVAKVICHRIFGFFSPNFRKMYKHSLVRDRPFNLKEGLWFFVSFRIFFSDNTRVRIFFFLSRKARI